MPNIASARPWSRTNRTVSASCPHAVARTVPPSDPAGHATCKRAQSGDAALDRRTARVTVWGKHERDHIAQGGPRQGEEDAGGGRLHNRAWREDADRAVPDAQGRALHPRADRRGDLLSGAQVTSEGAGHRARGLRGAPRG